MKTFKNLCEKVPTDDESLRVYQYMVNTAFMAIVIQGLSNEEEALLWYEYLKGFFIGSFAGGVAVKVKKIME